MSKDIENLLFDLKTVHEDLKPISAGIVVVANWVLKCRYGCRGYGSHLCCPHFAPTPQETRPGSFGVQICRAGQDPGSAFYRPNARLGQGSRVRYKTKLQRDVFELEKKAFLSGCRKMERGGLRARPG
jgi:predicted metal-binding protein